MLERCGRIRQRNTTITILKDKWRSFIRQNYMINVEIHTSKLTVTLGTSSKRKDVIFIRIRTKSSLSYNKVASQCNSQVLPPLIKIRQLNYIFESQYLQIFLKDYVGLNMIVHFSQNTKK